MKKRLKSIIKRSGLYKYYRDKVESGEWILEPIVLVNFFFQRVLRINGRCKFSVHYTSQITNGEEITFGYRGQYSLAVSGGLYIQAINGVDIGSNVLIAPGVKIISADHSFEKGERQQHLASKRLVIGDYCWLGANVVILPGVTLGNNVIVGAGSIVTKSFPESVIIAGNPARILKTI